MGSTVPPHSFRNCRVLLAEDEAFMAEEVQAFLEQQGATCLGPFTDVGEAYECARQTQFLDAAILDVNLRGSTTFEVADTLKSRGIPIVFWTGYDRSVIPKRFARTQWCEKPTPIQNLASILAAAMHEASV